MIDVQSRINAIPNIRQHIFEIFQYIVVPIPQRSDAALLKKAVALRIGFLRDEFIVLTTIKFDGEFDVMAVEVEHVRADSVLAAEFLIVQTAGANERPNQFLGIGRGAAQVADEGQCFFVEWNFLNFDVALLRRVGPFPHPPFGHLLPMGEGRQGAFQRVLVDFGGGKELPDGRCDRERAAAVVQAHDNGCRWPAEFAAQVFDLDTPALNGSIVHKYTRCGFEHDAGHGEVEIGAGEPARILERNRHAVFF